jgi:hypothetical protein
VIVPRISHNSRVEVSARGDSPQVIVTRRSRLVFENRFPADEATLAPAGIGSHPALTVSTLPHWDPFPSLTAAPPDPPHHSEAPGGRVNQAGHIRGRDPCDGGAVQAPQRSAAREHFSGRKSRGPDCASLRRESVFCAPQCCERNGSGRSHWRNRPGRSAAHAAGASRVRRW